MKKIVIPAAAALMGLVGCVESGLNADDKVVMEGTAFRENKSPLTDTTLKLYRDSNSACLIPDHYRDVPTDSVGKYSLDLTGAETQHNDIARCFELAIPTDDQGAHADVQFLMQVTQVDVPDLQLWNGAVAAADKGAGAEITYKSTFDTHGFESDTTLTLKQDIDTLWQATGVKSPVALDEYVLEDAAGVKAQLVTGREVKGSGVSFHQHFYSNEVAVPQKTLVPVSRGAACKFGAENHDTDCPYTDGKYTANAETSANDLIVTLAQPKALKRAVLRGFTHNIATNVVLQGSADSGTTWVELAKLPDGEHAFVEVDLNASAGAVNAFRIHLDGDQNPKILTLGEVSLFE